MAKTVNNNISLCIEYVDTYLTCCFNCFYLDQKSGEIIKTNKFKVEGGDIVSTSAMEIRKIAEEIKKDASELGKTIVGKINYVVASKSVFSYSNIFPKINKKKIVQYSRRDLEMSFPDFKKKNVYIENWHEDGNLWTCILTTLLPITVFERLDLLSREIGLKMGNVTTSSVCLNERYKQNYPEEFDSGALIDIEADYTVISLIVNKVMVDSVFINEGFESVSEDENTFCALVKNRLISVIAKHEFGLEKASISTIKITSTNNIISSALEKYLESTTSFVVGYTQAKELAYCNFDTKKSFAKFKKEFFKKGFTLVEVVVSLALFAILSGVALGCIVPMTNTVKNAERNSNISRTVNDITETFRLYHDNFATYYYEINNVTGDIVENKLFYDKDVNVISSEENSFYTLNYTLDGSTLTIDSFVKTGTTKSLLKSVTIRG